MKYKLPVAVLLLMLPLFAGCSSESAPDCFKNAGKTISYEVQAESFAAIKVTKGIELIIKQGEAVSVVIETGENLKDAVSARVENNELVLSNSTSCNWVRDYSPVKVYVTTPHLETIYSSSQFAVRSEGVLTFPSLLLRSGIFSETASGVFELEINCESLTVEDNQSAYYIITGAVNNVYVNFYSGNARFEGNGLIAQKAAVFHRSSNSIILNPQQEVTGTIYSTGNLVLKNHPPVVAVERLYTGKIIFE